MRKQILVLVISGLLTVPAWSGAASLGFVGSTANAKLSGVEAVAGSTVFDGDNIQVSSGGSLGVMLAGGSRALLAQETEVRLTRSSSEVIVSLEGGAVFISSSAKSPVEGAVADVTFRPVATGHPSIGWLGMDKAGRVVLYADRGDWLVITGHDGRSVLLRQGDRIEGSESTEDQNTDEQQKKKKKLGVVWIGIPLAGVTTGLGLAFGQSECTLRGGNPPETNPSCSKPAISPVIP